MAQVPFGYQGKFNSTSRRGSTALSKVTSMASTALARTGGALTTIASGSNTGVSSALASSEAWRFGFSDPSRSGSHALRESQYSMGWQAYSNELFEQISPYVFGGIYNSVQNRYAGALGTKIYLQKRGLYARTMPLYNPVRRLVDFYASHVFQGVLSEDGSQLPDGMALAIPLSKDTPPELKAAIAQGWFWGNWQRQKNVWIRFCAATGDGPVEIMDDVEKGNVYADPIWPGEISEIHKDRENVYSYTRNHRCVDDETGEEYILSRVVTPDRIATYRNGEPFEEHKGMGSEYDNPYGFCPLVWNCHTDFKSLPGGMAVRDWNKIEKLNSLSSRAYKYLERQMKTPMFLPDSPEVQKVKIDNASAEDELTLITSLGGGAPVPMEGNLDLAALEVRIESMMREIERDHPETTMYEELSTMNAVTGPAVEKILGNVAAYVNDARSGYDEAEVRKNQMLVAIGGYRFKEGKGGWKRRDNQQKKFAPFGLDSYFKGDLQHSINPRLLAVQSLEEQAQAKTAVAAAYGTMASVGEPFDFQVGEHGENWPQNRIDALHEAQMADATRQGELQKAMMDASTPPEDETDAGGEADSGAGAATPNNKPPQNGGHGGAKQSVRPTPEQAGIRRFLQGSVGRSLR